MGSCFPEWHDLCRGGPPVGARRQAATGDCPYTDRATLWIWHIPLKTKVIPGILNQQNSPYVLEMLKTATKACMDGLFDALVTGPIHKGIITDMQKNITSASHDQSPMNNVNNIHNISNTFSGHTEYFAELTNTPEVVMMLASDDTHTPANFRVALVTTHLPLSEIPKAITQEKIINIIRIIHHDFKKYFKNDLISLTPRIFVSGLNPHAGENGHLGREEIDVIIPALQKMREEGIHVEGPFPADTLFTKPYLAKADVFLAMYHDQGLAVLKYAAFDNAVNITLGLPFIRTSVDHGTALDLAGKGGASENSLIKAIQMAEKMVKNKQHEL